MANLYAVCEICKCRREKCSQPLGHKRSTGWVADWQPSRNERRIIKRFNSKLDNPKKQAEDTLAAWSTDRNRGNMGFLNPKGVTFYGVLADKYWTEHASVEGRHPERSTFYTVELSKEWIGIDRKVSPLTEDETKQFRQDMESVQRTLRAKGLAGATVNRYFNIIRSIFERGREWGLVKANPLEFVGRVQQEEPSPRFLEQADIDHLFLTATKLISFYDNPVEPEQKQRLIDFMTVLVHTGARPSSIEECSFDNGDVDFTNRVIRFTTYKGGAKKKKHQYWVPMDDDVFAIVHKRAEQNERHGLVFDTYNMRDLTKWVVAQSKLNDGKPENQHFTIYGLKHCYASHLLMSGASMKEVADLLGHTDGRMVQKHYGHLTMGHLRKVQSKINLTPTKLKVI